MVHDRDSAGSEANPLDETDSAIIKGVAIVAIVLHNFFHLLLPVKENEFEFGPERFAGFLELVRQPQWATQAVCSYLGHFGVQAFIFLSAYGLARKHWDPSEPFAKFLVGRMSKIYPTFVAAVAVWLLVIATFGGWSEVLEVLSQRGAALVLTAVGVESLVPGYGLPPVGPWWFLPFILQLYCLWPLLRALTVRFGNRGLTALALAGVGLTIALNGQLVARWSINLLETPAGHLPEICLGIAAARSQWLPRWPLAVLCGGTFGLSNLFGPVWIFGFVSALVLVLWVYSLARVTLRRVPGLGVLGVLSAGIFFVNGVVRLPLLEAARGRSGLVSWGCALAVLLLSVGLAAAFGPLRTKVRPFTAAS